MEKTSILKLPKGFTSILARKSGIKLLKSENLTKVKGWRLPDIIEVEKQRLPDAIGAKKRELPDTIGAEKRRLSGISKAERWRLSGSPKPKALSAIIKIRFIKPISIIEVIFYLCQRWLFRA